MMAAGSAATTNEEIFWTEYGIPIRNLWYMLLYAWNETPATVSSSLKDVEDAPTLDALLATVLMKLIQQRLRIGLGRNYLDEKRLLRGIRGRINFTESLKSRAFDRGQAYCAVQQYSVNVPKNQIVQSTLMRLVQVGNFGPDRQLAEELRHNLRWTTRLLDGVDLIELKLDFIRRQQVGRNDRDYSLMLAICELLLQRQMPMDNTDGIYRLPDLDRAALTLHHVYERFVANFYRLHLPDWNVSPQKAIVWHDSTNNKYLPAMRPDIFMEEKSTGRIIILDTKFTAHSLIANPWSSEKFDSAHLYQVYAYLKTQEHLSDQHRHAAGVLLYPAVKQSFLSEKTEIQGHAFRVETVNLTMAWQAIEQRLLDIVRI
ncbi:MAG TPA: hypothetical protein PKI33_00165 [Anaerolineales bacterium]|nr:hypothetical protein [Anaerolineales bacterium]